MQHTQHGRVWTCNFHVVKLAPITILPPPCLWWTRWQIALWTETDQYGLYSCSPCRVSRKLWTTCMSRCLACSCYANVIHCALSFTRALRYSPANIKICTIAGYCLFHSHAQVLTFTDSTRWTWWTGVLSV